MTNNQVSTNQNKAVSTQEKTITDNVSNRIKEMTTSGDIKMPSKYNYQNALKSAYLILTETVDKNKKPVLESCSKTSICNTLLDMCIQGLSPAKKQCYFIAFNGKLQLMKSYLGNIAATKRLSGIDNVFAQCIYEGDIFEYGINFSTGVKEITKHEQKFENINISNIKGAYAVVVREGKPSYVEIMTIDQIKSAWSMGTAYQYSNKEKPSAHDKFTDQMCMKTVINRACKNFVCTSLDEEDDLLIESITRTNEYKEEDLIETTHMEVKEEIKENANKEVIDINMEDVKVVQGEFEPAF